MPLKKTEKRNTNRRGHQSKQNVEMNGTKESYKNEKKEKDSTSIDETRVKKQRSKWAIYRKINKIA